MFLGINTPEWSIFEWKIEKLVVPTQLWEICILKNHQPIISIIKPGIIKIKLHKQQIQEFIKWTKFLFEDDRICISVWSWIIYVNGSEIEIITSNVTSEILPDEEVLEKMKKDMEEQIKDIKAKWSLDEVEKAFLHLQKITADLKLHKIKRRS